MPSGRCPYCKRHTVFQNLFQVDRIKGQHQQGINQGRIVIDRCQHTDCLAVVYRELHPVDSEVQYDIYPPINLDADEELPEQLKRSFGEALGTYLSGHWNASAQACGRALQDGMALLKPTDVEQQVWSHTDLKKQIARLVADNKLPPSIGDWAEEGRIGRNLASHGGDRSDFWADERDATAMLEFTKWIFRYVFVLPKQLEVRRKRLAELAAKNSASQSGPGSNAP